MFFLNREWLLFSIYLFMFHKGKFRPKNPSKYEGDPTNIIYRSGWELRFMIWADEKPSVIKWRSEETVVPYLCPTDNTYHRYFVDFQVQVRDKNGMLKTYLIEIKPEAQTRPPAKQSRVTKRYLSEVMTWGKNEAKWKAATEYAKDRGWEFKILTEHHLGIK
jgi:hypothetical protein